MANMAHGPFGSARNSQTLLQAAEVLSDSMTQDQFDILVEGMCFDLRCESEDHAEIPQGVQDIPLLPVFQTLPPYVPWTMTHKALKPYVVDQCFFN